MADMMKYMSQVSSSKDDQMKLYIAKLRGEGYPKAPAMPGFNQNTGASIFSTGNPDTTTTTTNTTTQGLDTTDNANILMQKMNLTDNNSANNSANVNVNKTSPPPSSIITTKKDGNGNGNGNGNANANLTGGAATTTTAAPSKVASPPASPADPNANVSEVNAVLGEVRRPLTAPQQQLTMELMEATMDAHLTTCMNTHKAVNEATARFYAMKEAGMLPDMSKMAPQSAGSNMWDKMTEMMMPEMIKTAQFCKMLPGFTELDQQDQDLLMKKGMFEVMLARFSMLIDHEKETMLDPSHKMIVPRSVVQQMPMGMFLNGFFSVGAMVNPLGLTDGELGLFTAMLVFCPTRPGLSEGKLIFDVLTQYQRALYTLIKMNHSDPEEVFSKALCLVPTLRRMNEEHDVALAAMKKQNPESAQKFPPLHREVFAVKQEAH